MSVNLSDIYAARARIHGRVLRTPLLYSVSLSLRCQAHVYLKLETVHSIGAFKIRGASNRIALLTDDERSVGVVTVSTGNHGRAVAAAAANAGVPAVVCMSTLVPDNKRAAIEDLGAEVKIIGESQDEAEVEARRLVAEDGLTLVHPFDDPGVIAGQGTIGLELLEDLPEVDMVIAGLSGGGLLGGIAVAVKAANPSCSLVGVSMERGPAMISSLDAGRPVLVPERQSLADSLGGGIGLNNRFTFDLIREHIDQTVLLSEPEIAEGMRHLYRHEGFVVEGAGGVGVAAMLAGHVRAAGARVVVIVSGRNVDMDVFTRTVAERPADAQ